ncbi:AgmX/PglI C-terminal domain-containing protein [Bermanella marisrubri]|uniref:Uncharacterized protein n=1 Tax=Bermanella marisrubri TaxID=207949 RepID=Q1N0P5_9GAMM|nr:AgmX/PglI C-terminal domain-containing protein [Bermanella marisrubri]EAT11788.1 hypothetical protein RED65_05359 [Oceanobacter sp. RED65] [Bermanella marisrubri]QIZ83823.1 AgmX/PglI C-terminal domain-containing protein [Bermanella marisrubri]
MSSIQYQAPQLPWSNGQQERLFKLVLIALLAVTVILGIVIPSIQLPEIERHKAEELPPQLARVIKRKKETPKPKPVPKVQEKPKPEKIEKKAEVKAKPKPVPKVVAKPKPKPKPKAVPKKERTPERVKAAKEKAKKLIADFSDNLSEMRSMADDMTRLVDNSALTNAGAAATTVGTVVDTNAVERVSGVDESKLTRETGAENLQVAERDTTEVEELPQEALADNTRAQEKTPGMARSQMDIRRVFEQNKSRFDRIYRRALRSNPVLQGTVTLGITVAASGEVKDCIVKESELDDKKVMRRMTMTCKMLAFDRASAEDEFEFPLTFAP